MDSFSIQFVKIIDDILDVEGLECKRLVFRNIKRNKEEVYYYARDILSCLNYIERDEINKLLNKVGKDNKFTISELYELYSSKGLTSIFGLNKELMAKIRQYEMKYVYVNKIGLYELILFSKSPKSKPLKDFVFKTLLVALDHNYHNMVKKQKINLNDIININNLLFSEIKEIKSIGYTLLNNCEKN